MNSIRHSQSLMQSSAAIATWCLLVALAFFVPSTVAFVPALIVTLFVSVSSSISLRMIEDTSVPGMPFQKLRRAICRIVPALIPLGWAILLAPDRSWRVMVVFAIVSLFPVAAAWVGLWLRAIELRRDLTATADDVQRLSGLHQLESADLDDLRFDRSLNERLVFANDSKNDFQKIIEQEVFELDSEFTESPDVTQWLKRSVTVDGEIIEGGVRIDFVEGQRDATVHLSFCPPFTAIPEVTTEDLDGADLEIRVAARFSFGTRLIVRRRIQTNSKACATPAESFRIGFVAIAAAIQHAA